MIKIFSHYCPFKLETLGRPGRRGGKITSLASPNYKLPF
jgi:hypothetical protein